MGETQLPQGWVWTTLGEVCSDAQYGWTTSASSEGSLRLLRTTDITSGRINWKAVPYCEADPPEPSKYLLRDGDIVISRAGSVGYSYLVKNPEHAVFASYLIRFRPLFDEQYTAYFLQSPNYWQSISEKSLGIAIPNVNATKLKQVVLPLAPLPEQQRIVAKIESLSTRLEASVAALKRAQANLKRYKASVLKAACEGRLAPQDPADEPAQKLLVRILRERRAKWEADLIAKGKDPTKAKYEEPKAPDTDGLPNLPEGWCWATVEQLAEVIGGVTKGRDFKGKRTIRLPYLRVANVQRSFLDLSEMKDIELLQDEVEKYRLHVYDLVLTEGGDWDKLGRSAIWRGQIENCVHQNHIFRARMYLPEVMPDWLMYYTNSEQGQNYFADASKQTTNLASINLTQLRSCPVSLPPFGEQRLIVAEVERRLSVVAEMEQTLAHNLARTQRLRQAILKKAFEGQLVEQDPNDEPAQKLLERIKGLKAEAEQLTLPATEKEKPGKKAKVVVAKRQAGKGKRNGNGKGA